MKSFDIRYNRVELKTSNTKYKSVFSKYCLIPNTNYHLLIKCKYTNFIVGVCKEKLKVNSDDKNDLHYRELSITYNCSNCCVYRDGMFESGSHTLTKGQKQLELILNITQSEMIILIGKNVVCRTALNGLAGSRLFLHLLMRTKGDSVEIDQ